MIVNFYSFLCKMYKYIIKGIDWHVNIFRNCPIYN